MSNVRDNQDSKPAVRFKGFSDAWEQRKLSDISKIFIGLVTTMTTNYTIKGTLLIRNSDIKDGRFEFSKTPIYLNEEFARKNRTRKLLENDVVTVHTGDIGTSAVVGPHEVGAIGFATINTRPVSQLLDSKFLSLFLNTVQHKQWALRMSTGDGRNNYNLRDFTRLVLFVPSITEQIHISKLLTLLNETIALHQRKVENLQKLKKSLLQQMFVSGNDQVPKIRFKGFADAWEKRKLGDLFHKVNERNNGQFDNTRWISVARMYFQEPDKVTSNNIDTRTFVMRKGDIAFEGHPNKEFMFGRFVENDIGDGVVSELFPIYRHSGKYNLNYWKYAVKLEWIWKYIFAKSITSSGNSSNKLDTRHFERQSIRTPTMDEQKKIGNFFASLDNLIAVNQRKVENLQKLKKSLLRLMFI
ncbi:type i restriction modification dna specificity domain protein [Schleiferilactobacillus harbinensis DSM 16991]|uniref:Type i restriction modification dna specificity domain protein n=1 Tax=Schleiferilactobacillus harbinensis DSM 16991 TaxID=1122147 RepID=A0A0R1XCQ3_9LACO|nr:restriction endonuclease subunit S [Schleiferilactobacillus harbinensis]KRM26228.1 type i restriction modification dna specificity domain protein [Schleiferilactobacillus harbinensis DSM 16991]